ncbi:MFS general substrate transporter [Amniculicola lignicola CBS 123094]|uniref:MFS general substrate transporter n=1 Tax=Amniculicola lignicola CBS 123094 TaxID=1392246 RepID=A0A6A5W6J4_9PLEO|nr:MFS general substrate transporter [Amniculicola lignicola CBS 123094]
MIPLTPSSPPPSFREHAEEQEEEEYDESQHHLSGIKLYLIIIALCLSVILVALDNAILATAIPTITASFNSLKDVGWYGSSFLIAICALQPLTGKIYQQFPLKFSYLAFLFIFEMGSLVCAVSPSSLVLILGRTVAGIGASGLFSGALVIIAHSIPLRLRPIYTGIIASMFGVANILGPILGGVITQHLTWRWCFWINLPAGAVTAVLLFFLFASPPTQVHKLSFAGKLKALELPGFFMFIPTAVMFLLALQWGGTKYEWSSPTIIGLLVGSMIMLVMFGTWQWHEGDNASIPPRVIGQRTVACCAVLAFLAFGSLQLTTYYLPIWFQVIKNASPTRSGVLYLPTVAGDIVFSVLGGVFVTQVGYYNPVVMLGCVCIAIGGGLLTTIQPHFGSSLVGYQVLLGAGFGAVIPTPLIAVQAVLPLKQVPTATSTLMLMQFLGGSIFLSIAQNIFESKLTDRLTELFDHMTAEQILKAGAGAVRKVVPPEQLPSVLMSYNDGISMTFYIVAASGVIALIASLGMQWRSVKGMKLSMG